MGIITFSAKRSNPHSVGAQYAVGTQCTVGVSAKGSNMGDGDPYL